MASPIQVYIERKYKGEYVTSSEAAELVGRSLVQVQRYRRRGEFVPSKVEQMGGITVPLYSEEDIEALKDFVSKQRTGPKSKSS